jgi:hypothetical protein
MIKAVKTAMLLVRLIRIVAPPSSVRPTECELAGNLRIKHTSGHWSCVAKQWFVVVSFFVLLSGTRSSPSGVKPRMLAVVA